MIGTWVGPYFVREILGEGGMGTVYLAQHGTLPRLVAIKSLTEETRGDAGRIKRFRQEAINQAPLENQNIARVYDLIEEERGLFLVIEYIPGDDLSSILSENGPFSADDALFVFAQILLGVAHAHERGILHRDLKLSNVMLTPDGVAKILDFGIARSVSAPKMTQTGFLVGTPEYMAPEVIQGKEVGPQADIYALGIILYHLLTGSTPFEKEVTFDVFKAHLEEEPPDLDLKVEGVPPAVKEGIERALSKKPEDRWPSAASWLGALVPLVPKSMAPQFLPVRSEIELLSDLGRAPKVGRTGSPMLPKWALWTAIFVVVAGIGLAFVPRGSEPPVEPQGKPQTKLLSWPVVSAEDRTKGATSIESGNKLLNLSPEALKSEEGRRKIAQQLGDVSKTLAALASRWVGVNEPWGNMYRGYSNIYAFFKSVVEGAPSTRSLQLAIRYFRNSFEASQKEGYSVESFVIKSLSADVNVFEEGLRSILSKPSMAEAWREMKSLIADLRSYQAQK